MDLEIDRTGLEKKFYDLCKKVVEEEGLELYALDYLSGQHLLRLYVQNPETKTALIEECVQVDRALSPWIDSEEWMPAELTLEVSSPGVYREIKEGKVFKEHLGERLALTLLKKLDEQALTGLNDKEKKKLKGQKKIIGYLEGLEEETLKVSLGPKSENTLKIKLLDIKKANVEPAWEDIKES